MEIKEDKAFPKDHNTDHKGFIDNPEPIMMEEKVLLIKTRPPSNSSKSYMKCIIIICVIVVLLVASYFLFIKEGQAKEITYNIFKKLQDWYVEYPKSITLLLILIQILNLLTILPLFTIITFLSCAILKNPWLAFALMLFSAVSTSLVVYIICRSRLKGYCMKKYEHNEFFQMLRIQSIRHPWRTAFLTRFLFISAGLKEYFLPLIDNPFPAFWVSAWVVHAVFTMEFCLIYSEVKNIDTYLNSKRTWGDLTMIEKASKVFVIILIIFTVALIIFLGYKAHQIFKKSQKMKAKPKSDELSQKNE